MVDLPSDLTSWLSSNGYGTSFQRETIGGGCISQACLIEARDGKQVFVKYREQVPDMFFAGEAEGLTYLSHACNLPVPDILGYGGHFIALEYLPPGRQKKVFWEELGRHLALLHQCTREDFGFINDNYCGDTPQPNSFCRDGYEFFATHRLQYQADLARSKGLLNSTDMNDIASICNRLREWIPEQPASLLHGDLWSGNVHVNQLGHPVFIDPAVYFSWAEIDIAMTRLFGGFPETFYSAYQEVRPLDPGWESRLDIYNLYPLLNHLNLFGRGYLGSVRAVLNTYCR